MTVWKIKTEQKAKQTIPKTTTMLGTKHDSMTHKNRTESKTDKAIITVVITMLATKHMAYEKWLVKTKLKGKRTGIMTAMLAT